MPLVVPALRFFVIFLNVYETFKTLKPPPPSARRGGQPSTRAITQRKRDLKGCLAVWVVWCCYAVYERTFDKVVGIFLPFYSEIKSAFLLFLLLTRAKGAEPLFLHTLRPLIKPYTAVVDPMLELSRDVGDFFFVLLQVPLDYILSSSWIPSWHAGKLEEVPIELTSSECIGSADAGSSTLTNNHSRIPVLADHNGAAQTSHVLNSRHGSIRSVSDSQCPNGFLSVYDPTGSRASLHRPSSSASLPTHNEHPRYSQTLSVYNGRQICSSASAHHLGVPESRPNPFGTTPEYHSPEWRTYPAFPSAYPPTPLPASACLPSSVPSRSGSDPPFISDSTYPPIPEDLQGFGEMLERMHDGFPGPMRTSGNSTIKSCGVNTYEGSSEFTRHPDEDTLLDDSMCSEAGLSEDDFGTSLKTPHRLPKAIPLSAYTSEDSVTSALTAADNAPPFKLQTKTSSDSLSSGASSLAGRKRAFEASQGKARSVLATSRNATLRGKPLPPPITWDPPQSSASEGEDESEVGGDNSDAKAKRRRVLDPLKRKSTVRPTARGLGNARKASLPLRSATVRVRTATTTSKGTTLTRAGTMNSAMKGLKPTLASRQSTLGGPPGVVKSTSTSSSQSGTLRRKAY